VSKSLRPIIGITTYIEQAAWGVWNKPAALLPATYVRAVEAAGGRPVLLPPMSEATGDTLDVLDGVLFSGGSDIDPTLYGREPHPETKVIRPERDQGEHQLISDALDRDIPVLAICRGMELLNIARGGTLEQHLPDRTSEIKHKDGSGVYATHEVVIKPDSKLGSILGASVTVRSHHHQAPDVVGETLDEVAWAPDDTIEGIEMPSKRFVIGVIWHPEEGEDPSLFEALVEESRA
jgi:putative glutamine amidotransferase